jgi:hypothetical protein
MCVHHIKVFLFLYIYIKVMTGAMYLSMSSDVYIVLYQYVLCR